MPCCCHWGHHCPHCPPPAPGSARDEHIRLLEAERAMLDQRLRRLEEQLAELQRERTSR